MGYKRDMIMLAVVSVSLILMSLLGIIWDFVSGLLFSGLDGILLLAICLMMGGVFTLELLIVGRQAGWIPSRTHGKPALASASAAKGATAAAPVTPRPATPLKPAGPATTPPAAKAVPPPAAAPVVPSAVTPSPAPAAPGAAPPTPELPK